MTNRTRYRTEAELKALFEQTVSAIGFYEAQRKPDGPRKSESLTQNDCIEIKLLRVCA